MNGRALAGTVSANSVTAAANTPPTPRPVRKRNAWNSNVDRDSALRPVNAAYMPMVSMSVFTRPQRSPRMPKKMPPVAHPARKNDVAHPAAVRTSAFWSDATTFSSGTALPSAFLAISAFCSANRESSFVTFGTSDSIAGFRASANNCWSMQSMSHARQQTMNTNH